MKTLNAILFIVIIANAIAALLVHDSVHSFLGWLVAVLMLISGDLKKAN